MNASSNDPAAFAPQSISPAELEAAYAVCRTIARREAKNFYYAFVALPRPKRDAICAIYAFMRKADDLADDESLAIEARRAKLNAWTAAWHAAGAGGETADPVFIAVRDATARYAIPASLLDELVAGVTMDIDAAHSNMLDTYETFDELYRYCYLVASVVGLHPRTLQRRLREEGTTFEEIKDGVRRDVALRCLRQRHIPLIRVAEILGYSETSVLSRSCYRWFARSPRQLRNQMETDSSESEALAS